MEQGPELLDNGTKRNNDGQTNHHHKKESATAVLTSGDDLSVQLTPSHNNNIMVTNASISDVDEDDIVGQEAAKLIQVGGA